MRRVLVLALLVCPAVVADGLRLPAVLGDGMVLQRETEVPLWGRAAPGTPVAIAFAGQELEATADASGRWRAALAPLEASAAGRTLTVRAGDETVEVRDVLVGEVWICSGQSNMEWPLRAAHGGAEEIEAARHPALRLLVVPNVAADEPADDIAARWRPCTPDAARGFSAVGYFFGREIHRQLDVPVGLIAADWGGTRAEAWTPREALPAGVAQRPARGPQRASALYNGMIAPLVPFAIRGAVWYQGESNAHQAARYRELQGLLIAGWRRAWGREFSFYITQLASFRKAAEGPGPSAWAELREAQLLAALEVPRSGIAVTIDIGEADNIHPGNKLDVGRRLALWALARDYGRDALVHSGPIYSEHQVEGAAVRVSFDHVGSGLVARGGPLARFEVAGRDGRFVVAEARIEGPTVIVSSPEVEHPLDVRYAWADNPAGCNLYNEEGLPATPFRTDRPPR